MYDDKLSLEDVIEHFGVRGMHWGKRKSIPSEPSKDPPRIYSTHLPTQEQLLSGNHTPVKINPSAQKHDQTADEISKDFNRMIVRSLIFTNVSYALSHGPQMKTAYRLIKNSPRMLRGEQAVARQGRSLLENIGRLPIHSLTPVKASVRMIGRSLSNPRN